MSKLVAVTLMAGVVTLATGHPANAGFFRRWRYCPPATTVWQAPAPVQAAPVAPAPAAPQTANRRTYQSYSYEPGAPVYQWYPVYQPRYYYAVPFGSGQSSSRGGTAGSPAPYGY